MNPQLTRREALGRLAALTTAALAFPRLAGAQAKTPIIVYKDQSCGCCQKWVEHLQENGFSPSVIDSTKMESIKIRYKVAPKVQSCHTAVLGTYVVEGHVPAADIRRLMALKPAGIVGLTIPGMPASAPGMDAKPFQPYTVRTFDETGKTTVFAKHDRG